MAWTRYQIFLAWTMVITGSINTLSVKWADKLESKGSNGELREFNHPFVQTAAMFLGEILCLLVFKIMEYRNRTNQQYVSLNNATVNPFILMPAAMFDLIATSIMYVGLILTYASSFQMFRGSVVIFVAVLSMTVLNKQLNMKKWFGILNIIFGLVIVGVTDACYDTPDSSRGTNSLITGDLLIIVAQVITACQMVYEEKYVAGRHIPPLQAVGWEGVFGFSVLSVMLFIFYWIPAPPHFGPYVDGPLEDVIDAFVQIGNNSLILMAILGNIISIAFFNFAGISVTVEMSATTRMVLDSIRTLVIWMVSLAVKWQSFHWQHLIGFFVLIFGTCYYNDIIPSCVTNTNEAIEEAENTPEENIVNIEADVVIDGELKDVIP